MELNSQILQCVAMNVTLIYALLAYYSIKQKSVNGFYVSKLTGRSQRDHHYASY